jgi:PBP1b-binding outer membrane lipoprotein LpoB
MKPISRISLFLISLFLLNGCSNNNNNNATQITKEETPEALQDEHLEISKVYGKRSEDLVEKIYLELLNKDPEFQKLDVDIRESKNHQTELENQFSEFNSKSSDYYSAASRKATAIKNALLKERMEKLISASSNNYTSGVS